MDKLISGLVNTAIDAASSVLHREKSPPSSPIATGDSTSIDRSTWAEIAAGKGSHENKYEEHPLGQYNRAEPKHGGNWHSTDHRHDSVSQYQKQSYLSATSGHSQEETNEDDDNSGWQTAGRPHGRSHLNRPKKEENEDNKNSGRQSTGRPHGSRFNHYGESEHWQQFKKPPHEQHFADAISSDVEIQPTEEELQDVTLAYNRLWELDINRLTPGVDYEINCGDGKKIYDKQDMADNSLFQRVNKDVFRRPTYARFFALLDNYTAKQGVREHVTDEERQEEAAFIEEISRTAPIKYLHKYLSTKGVVSRNLEEFKRELNTLWFALYGRGGGQASSSGFEHVFVGEVKSHNGVEEISGFHNWIKFFLEEAAGRVDYQGYILPRRRNSAEPDAHSQCLSVQFTWNGILKPVSSTFIGVSPEFELALYTLCFYEGSEDNFMELGPYSVNIKCYKLGRNRLGSCFPIAQE